MDHAENFSSRLNEFIRYCLAGGMAFCVDFGVLVLSGAALPRLNGFELYAAAALGFLAGLAVHYVLSFRFFFRAPGVSGCQVRPAGFRLRDRGAVFEGLTEAEETRERRLLGLITYRGKRRCRLVVLSELPEQKISSLGRKSNSWQQNAVIIGAGPAGLTASYKTPHVRTSTVDLGGDRIYGASPDPRSKAASGCSRGTPAFFNKKRNI
jgi:hypothetical protein